MLHALTALVGNAAAERLTLLMNHVLAGEPAAMQRLKLHQGRSIAVRFEGWPNLLPPLPGTAFLITAAGLLEWCGAEAPMAPDLSVAVDASNPAAAALQALAGSRPKVDIAGDAALATDLNWVFDNVRWDAQDDLAKLVGDAPAREIGRVAGGIAAGLRGAVKTFRGLVDRAREPAGGHPPR